MIHFLNRKEIYIGYSMEKQGQIREALSVNNIDYKVKVINQSLGNYPMGNRRTGLGTYGHNMDYNYEYHIYVAAKDFEIACQAIQTVKN